MDRTKSSTYKSVLQFSVEMWPFLPTVIPLFFIKNNQVTLFSQLKCDLIRLDLNIYRSARRMVIEYVDHLKVDFDEIFHKGSPSRL